MRLSLENERLPKKFKQNEKEFYLDPIRKRLVQITPEETVRQQMISYLIDKLKVPDYETLLCVEERLSHYGVDSPRRADIIINEYTEGGIITPVCIIECKAPNHILGEKTINQVLDYCDAISCDYAIITNGIDAFYFRYDDKKHNYFEVECIKNYSDFLDDKYVLHTPDPLPERIPFEGISEYIQNNDCYEIGQDTPLNLAHLAFNISECLLDTRHRLNKKEFKLFNIIDDYGIRLVEYGNHSGGSFQGAYRSFLIDDNGNAKFVSLAVSDYTRGEGYPVRTALNVAIDTEKTAHHSLQLTFDENVQSTKNTFKIYHSGRIGISNLGSGNISELKGLLSARYPQIMINDKIYLGSLTDNRLFDINDEEIVNFIENLISYALIRDEYREIVKKRNKK